MDAENDEDAPVPEIDGDLGDDVFGQSAGAGPVESGKDAWVVEGREPTYQEVSLSPPVTTVGPMWDGGSPNQLP
jgi:hypothetical protein